MAPQAAAACVASGVQLLGTAESTKSTVLARPPLCTMMSVLLSVQAVPALPAPPFPGLLVQALVHPGCAQGLRGRKALRLGSQGAGHSARILASVQRYEDEEHELEGNG